MSVVIFRKRATPQEPKEVPSEEPVAEIIEEAPAEVKPKKAKKAK